MAAPTGRASGASPAKREHWSGQTAFILAAVGSAVGLGNIWRFPGQAYEAGGGAFMIPYLVALVAAGIPILFLENGIGHRFRGSAPLAMRRSTRRGTSRAGEGVGWWHVAVCFVIGLYYTAVIAWAASYFFFSFDLRYADDPGGFFLDQYLRLGEPGTVSLEFVPGVLWPLLGVWAVAIAILALGVAHGVERLNVIGIPLLVVTFLILAARALTLEGAGDGLSALFTPDFAALRDVDVWIAAFGQVFFSLSLAYGVMITYASYRRRRSNITGPALVVAFGNSSFSMLAGIAVFSALGFLAHQEGVAVADLEGYSGVDLSFVTFPAVIAQMPGGAFFGALFFAGLVIAGLTSLISVLQTISAALQDKFGWNPRVSAVVVGVISAVLSAVGFATTTGLFLLDVVDQWSNQLGIVAGAVAMIAAALWFGRRGTELRRHLSTVSTFRLGRAWVVLVNVVALVLIFMFVSKAVTLGAYGYGDYPTWYVVVFGWGTAAFLLAVAAVLSLVRWRRDVRDFSPWPTRAQLNLPAQPDPTGASAGREEHQ
ncbi:sodium-dependent transporter [Demequina activiva]|uniref:Sodium-dependent transporter n=1 Tax=Demequina activiva TaxID=1582364 RepID=A0A919Q1B1_9MICO|nr:sodium-dependent transporter [Demequina activiva]GIG54352.1 sodium-dependent transporter [Demequina activiva]